MTSPTGQCRAEYPRAEHAMPNTRIIRCHLRAGHPGEHEEADTEVTWNDPPTAERNDSEERCPTCGTVSYRFDPPLVFVEAEQCGAIKPGNWTADYVPVCEMPKGHDGKHVHLVERTETWDR